jgi:hypothetical protein
LASRSYDLIREWVEAHLNGLGGDDATNISWIRVSDDARASLAVELSGADTTLDEASMCLGYGGGIDRPWPSLYETLRDWHLTHSEVIVCRADLAAEQYRRLSSCAKTVGPTKIDVASAAKTRLRYALNSKIAPGIEFAASLCARFHIRSVTTLLFVCDRRPPSAQ